MALASESETVRDLEAEQPAAVRGTPEDAEAVVAKFPLKPSRCLAPECIAQLSLCP